jgi:hypothetical protein
VPAGVEEREPRYPVLYRDGSDLITPGLYLDLPPWGRHVFSVPG